MTNLKTLLAAAALAMAVAAPAHADRLPPQFLGFWGELYETEEPGAAEAQVCTARSGVTITRKSAEWNTESPCGPIARVVTPHETPGNETEHGRATVTVTLTCVKVEGWTGGPDTQVWRLFKVKGKTFMAQTSLRTKDTSILEKCE